VGRRSLLRAGLATLLALAVLLAAGPSRAAGDDAAVATGAQAVLNEEYASASYSDAKKKLQTLLDRCTKSKKCSAATKAQVYVAMGMVSSQIGQAEEAKAHFTSALQEDASTKLPGSGTSPNIRSQFAEAQKSVAPPPPPPAPAATEEEEKAAVAVPAAAPEEGRAPPGWSSAKAFKLASAAVAAKLAGNLDECIDQDKESLKLEEQPGTRLHLASCENKADKVLDAVRDAQKALQLGIQRKNAPVMKVAAAKIQEFIARIAHVTFVPPAGVSDLKVTFDERAVPTESLTKKFSIDPGKHKVKAEGTGNGIPLGYDEEIVAKDGELVTVKITLTSKAPEFLTQGQLKCMRDAKSQEEILKCLPQKAQNLVVKAGLDVSGYTDTNHVHIFTPAINASVTSPTSGWNFGGSYLVDVVTAASPDIVSEASGRYKETRYAATLNGGYKPGLYGIQGNAGVSAEPDYRSIHGGLAITGDFKDKLITPRLAYSHSADTIGRNTTPFDTFHNTLLVNDFEGSVTIVMSPTSLIQVGARISTERGDQSKLYRFIPMFSPLIASRIPVGATVDLVNFYRLPFRPLEQLPTERDRYAAGIRFLHRFTTATLRLEERIYDDSWQQKSTTTDLRYMQDLGRYLRVWPHVRFNAQTSANFYQLAYAALVGADGKITTPTYRSNDRELGPLITMTAGGGSRIALGSPEATTQYAITIAGDLMYTRFLNSLFVTTRTAVYGSVGFDVEFQ
jgi:hypothetical protein